VNPTTAVNNFLIHYTSFHHLALHCHPASSEAL
jgi:hypothetical protein